MELSGENQGANTCAAQIFGARGHFAAEIGELRATKFGRDDAAAFDAEFEAVKMRGGEPKSFVGAIEIVEALRMILLVEAFRTEQFLQAAQRFWNVLLGSRFTAVWSRAQRARRETCFG